MSAVEQIHPDTFFTESERAWLVRYCASLSGRPEQAEDLAQETLVEAWRNRHKLVDPTGRLSWLAAIARYVIQRWFRQQGRDQQHLVSLDDEEMTLEPWQHEQGDFEHDLERAELVILLDRALALLPAETRLALIAHYVEELPQAEIAARLGMSAGTLAVRLHRGKLALRRLFATDLREDALAYGLGGASAGGWHELSLWCPICGQQHLQGQINSDDVYLLLRCSACSQKPLLDHRTRLLDGITTCRVAFNRVLDWVDAYFPPALQKGFAPCIGCGRIAPIRQGNPLSGEITDLEQGSMHVACTCAMQNTCDLPILALASREGRAFWREHPRIRLLPLSEQEVGGALALRVSFMSLADNARLDLLAARDTLQPLHVYTTP